MTPTRLTDNSLGRLITPDRMEWGSMHAGLIIDNVSIEWGCGSFGKSLTVPKPSKSDYPIQIILAPENN